jgi:hypothetical protein
MVGAITLGVTVLASTLLDGGAFGSTTTSTPAGGTVNVYVTPTGQGVGTILITGAIGDYGKTASINKDGKSNPNGNYGTITLQKGSFEVNKTALITKLNNSPGITYKATCSAQFSGTATVPVFNGSGLYKGITGTVEITETVALIGPVYASGKNKGQCNESNNATPLKTYASISGSGTVSFSG